MHASLIARNLFLVSIFTFLVHSPAPNPLSGLANTVFCVGPPNQIGHPAHSRKLFKQVPLISAYGI